MINPQQQQINTTKYITKRLSTNNKKTNNTTFVKTLIEAINLQD